MVLSRRISIVITLVEILAGLAFLVMPLLAGRLLVGEDLTGPALIVIRLAGIALISLGIACRPGPLALGLLVYNAGAALYFLYVGMTGEATGMLLWPAVILHGVLAIWIARELYLSRPA